MYKEESLEKRRENRKGTSKQIRELFMKNSYS
ncbi:hypothetical protein EYZ11_012829 [Aspergillus tanneri]|uniref:Uncharacterized protein n=1 Tax=Aspergillus tanneri TaxID=1220188 RepID=A0A4S3IZH2_9EURO|nr:hypothetical protein EYZ11_012829 [Aspergillus tanneri]